jgi:hypothetical protein
MMIVPGDRNSVPTRFGDRATVSSISLPANAVTFLEVLRFGGGQMARPLGLFEFISSARVCDKDVNANFIVRPSRHQVSALAAKSLSGRVQPQAVWPLAILVQRTATWTPLPREAETGHTSYMGMNPIPSSAGSPDHLSK